MSRPAYALILLLATGASAPAQDIARRIPLERVAEVQIHGLLQSTLRGRVAAVDSAGIRLLLTRQGSSVLLPWANVASLRWATEKSHTRGTFEGAFLGVVLGGSMYINGYPRDPFDVMSDAGEAALRRRLTIFASGIAVGSTVIGLVAGSRKWTAVPIPPLGGGAIALDLHPNDDVRIESTLGRIDGRQAVAGDSLRLVTSAGPVTLPWRNVGDLQVRGGHRRARGVLYGATAAFLATSVSQGFVHFTTLGWFSNVAVGGAAGWRYLSPEGWVSLPQPRR